MTLMNLLLLLRLAMYPVRAARPTGIQTVLTSGELVHMDQAPRMQKRWQQLQALYRKDIYAAMLHPPEYFIAITRRLRLSTVYAN